MSSHSSAHGWNTVVQDGFGLVLARFAEAAGRNAGERLAAVDVAVASHPLRGAGCNDAFPGLAAL